LQLLSYFLFKKGLLLFRNSKRPITISLAICVDYYKFFFLFGIDIFETKNIMMKFMTLQLQPCAKVETFLPPGTRLWGRSRVGLRCTDGTARWQVFLPTRIKAMGPAWVLRSTLPANSVLSEQDAILQEVDWAESASPVLAKASDWVGKSLARNSLSGETLSLAMVRVMPVFTSGTRVKLVAQGPGFNIATAGHALGAGVPGQNVSVRLESGRIVSGKVNSDGVVTLGL
jgi:flagella basal body P-ring formation protein FlgA